MSDPVTVSVLTHRLEAIVQEMGEAMLRTAYSQILNSSRDFSTALCDAQARLIAQAEHVPIHVGAIPWAVESVRDAFKGRVRPGDVYLLNDPYHGNNHLPDLTAFVPVFVGDEVAFWSINRAHQSDIGGSTHGAYNPGATEIWQEGLRITPLKLYDAGELRDDVLKMITTNVRHPHDFMGDLRAMIGSARVGERRLLALVREYGADDGRWPPSTRSWTAPSCRRGAASRPGRTASITARRSWTTTATSSGTSGSAPPSPRRATGSPIDLSDSPPAGAPASSTRRSRTRCRRCTWPSRTSSIRGRRRTPGPSGR